jgi:quercetin dioxygenase-like cupin family protein
MESGITINLANSISYADSSVVSKTIIKKPTGTVTLFAFDINQGLSPHVAPFDALVQILDGECLFSIEQDKFQMKTGDCLLLPAGKIHSVDAVRQFKMLLTMIKVNELENQPKFSRVK